MFRRKFEISFDVHKFCFCDDDGDDDDDNIAIVHGLKTMVFQIWRCFIRVLHGVCCIVCYRVALILKKWSWVNGMKLLLTREKISKTKDLFHNDVSIALLVELTKVFLLTNLGFFGWLVNVKDWDLLQLMTGRLLMIDDAALELDALSVHNNDLWWKIFSSNWKGVQKASCSFTEMIKKNQK